MLKSFQYEMRAIFTESLVHETLFNTVVYGSNETHIIMHNLIMQNRNQLKFWKSVFFWFISSGSCYKKMLLESLNIPLSICCGCKGVKV